MEAGRTVPYTIAPAAPAPVTWARPNSVDVSDDMAVEADLSVVNSSGEGATKATEIPLEVAQEDAAVQLADGGRIIELQKQVADLLAAQKTYSKTFSRPH